MAETLKIAVGGPIPRDTITTHLGETVEKYGCALYTTAVLSSWVDEGSMVYPVTHVRKSDEPEIKATLETFKHVDLSHIDSALDQGDVINLKYVDKNRRNEQQTGFMNPLLPEDFEDLLDCDAFVFVPITDYEVPLETLRYLKQNSKGLVVFDAAAKYDRQCKQLGHKIAAASSSANVQYILEQAGIIDEFDVILGGHQVTKGKPNPEIFLSAAHQLGMPVEDCIVFEDSESGVRAAHDGGFFCVGVVDASHDADLSLADVIVASVADYKL